MDRKQDGLELPVEAVVTSFNQGAMILEAVASLCAQTVLPEKIIIIDDGSTDLPSLEILKSMENSSGFSVPILVCYQKNGGVSSARNSGIRKTRAPLVLILDGDDKLAPEYIEQVSKLLREHPSMVAASSHMHTFGVLDSLVCPSGGKINAFLSRNCCPATHILRRSVFMKCMGYDESMRSGFEDWDFFLSILETDPDAWIGIVKQPLIQYRTAPASSNVKSMNKRLELMRFLIEKHKESYHAHLAEALLGIEAISDSRLCAWEQEVLHAMENRCEISRISRAFLESPTYGDGGMASAVRIISAQKEHGKNFKGEKANA